MTDSAVLSAESDGMEVGRGTLRLRLYLSTLVQLALVCVAIDLLQIESRFGLPMLAPILFVGFAAHALMPLSRRPPFFLLVSMVGIVVVMGIDGFWVLLLGGGLFSICSLPIGLRARGVLLGVAGVLLALLRLDGVGVSWAATVVPIVASMFMFRVVLYLFDEKAADHQAPLWQRLGYFFMLPNVCFPLFPVVDYTTFRRGYFRGDTAALYQRGLRWMVRGLTHVLLYRLVYHLVLPAPWELVDSRTVLLSMVSGYLLYLRISGQFHFIAGALCLFGYDLPETHHRYFLASSFNDYWRRINVYWKDFVEKVVFYPAFLRLRRWGAPQPMIFAILLTFAATWMLHSYQWFWLRGTFPVTAMDGLFWMGFSVFVVANSLLEALRTRRPRKAETDVGVKAMLLRAVQTVSMFSILTVLWSLWGAESLDDWTYDMSFFAADIAWLPWVGAAIGVALVAGIAVPYASLHLPAVLGLPRLSWRALIGGPTALLLCGVGLLPRAELGGDRWTELVSAVTEDNLNEQDLVAQTRGYYESVLSRQMLTSELARTEIGKPSWWTHIKNTHLSVPTDDIRGARLVPNATGTHKGANVATNRWGMRDRDYELEKPAGTYRIALLGDSYTMGTGVDNPYVFEQLVEERVNARYSGERYERIEILNFSKEGYLMVNQVGFCQEIVPSFEPDAVFVADDITEGSRVVLRLAREPRLISLYPKPWLAEWTERRGVHPGNTPDENIALLQPRGNSLVERFLKDVTESCGRGGAKVVWLWVPVNQPYDPRTERERDRRMEVARSMGMIPISLDGSYGEHTQEELSIAPWDTHPNRLGHRLLADAMIRELERNSDALGLELVDR